MVVLHDDGGMLPLGSSGQRLRIYAEGLPDEVIATLGEQVPHPSQADLALLRIGAPFPPGRRIPCTRAGTGSCWTTLSADQRAASDSAGAFDVARGARSARVR